MSHTKHTFKIKAIVGEKPVANVTYKFYYMGVERSTDESQKQRYKDVIAGNITTAIIRQYRNMASNLHGVMNYLSNEHYAIHEFYSDHRENFDIIAYCYAVTRPANGETNMKDAVDSHTLATNDIDEYFEFVKQYYENYKNRETRCFFVAYHTGNERKKETVLAELKEHMGDQTNYNIHAVGNSSMYGHKYRLDFSVPEHDSNLNAMVATELKKLLGSYKQHILYTSAYIGKKRTNIPHTIQVFTDNLYLVNILKLKQNLKNVRVAIVFSLNHI